MVRSTFEENVFVVDSPSKTPVNQLNKVMERDTFACIRGVISKEETEEALKTLAVRFSRSNDSPSLGERPEQVRTNFQKLIVGGESRTRSNDDARLFRVLYNPIWEEDIYGLRDIFIRLAKVRNVIAGLPESFAIDRIEPNGLWTASRIHQYPTGGGFFRRHTDYAVNDVANEAGTKFYQLLLLMTRKGEHFETGGGFVDLGDERICLEDHFEPGDILIYDGRSSHGVEDIDAHLPLDLDKFTGRVSAFVTLFKVMS